MDANMTLSTVLKMILIQPKSPKILKHVRCKFTYVKISPKFSTAILDKKN